MPGQGVRNFYKPLNHLKEKAMYHWVAGNARGQSRDFSLAIMEARRYIYNQRAGQGQYTILDTSGNELRREECNHATAYRWRLVFCADDAGTTH